MVSGLGEDVERGAGVLKTLRVWEGLERGEGKEGGVRWGFEGANFGRMHLLFYGVELAFINITTILLLLLIPCRVLGSGCKRPFKIIFLSRFFITPFRPLFATESNSNSNGNPLEISGARNWDRGRVLGKKKKRY